jgi:hypothetical protein
LSLVAGALEIDSDSLCVCFANKNAVNVNK